MRFILAVITMAAAALLAGVTAASALEPGFILDEAIFSVKDGRVAAPRAVHVPDEEGRGAEELSSGWRPAKEGDYYAFDASELLSPDRGTLEVSLTITDVKAISAIGNGLEALVTVYDEAGVPFFSVGINDHDVMVGSFPLHPQLMEDVFGGVGFPYVAKLDGPLADGSRVKITVVWGPEPADNKVLINGRFEEVAVRKGPRHAGDPPGFVPTATFASFMDGFEGLSGRNAGPAKTLVIGRMGSRDPSSRLSMYPPASAAINSVRLANFIIEP
ncbi:MAG: hypothetical protein HZA22_04020 [Nitrospirae bacterium]|nr:hypothetical protein [Nitrospirota bacterium]MBI5694745.1 hypothetical protein [Nitrospirota bacterium]